MEVHVRGELSSIIKLLSRLLLSSKDLVLLLVLKTKLLLHELVLHIGCHKAWLYDWELLHLSEVRLLNGYGWWLINKWLLVVLVAASVLFLLLWYWVVLGYRLKRLRLFWLWRTSLQYFFISFAYHCRATHHSVHFGRQFFLFLFLLKYPLVNLFLSCVLCASGYSWAIKSRFWSL